MRSRRSISDIVAVVLLIVIAIAAAVIIYMWLSGLIGSVHTSTSAMQLKLEITGANVTYVQNFFGKSNLKGYNVIAYVYNPPGSPSTSITLGELEFTNGTLICSNKTYEEVSGSLTITPTTVTPSGTTEVPFFCNVSQLPPGTPVEIILITSEGVQVTYTATVS